MSESEAIFKPAPDGPPRYQIKVKFEELYAWLDSNPGEWALVENINTNFAGQFRMRGYEATTRKRAEGSNVDIWVRKEKGTRRR